jgi:hypothetical protein
MAKAGRVEASAANGDRVDRSDLEYYRYEVSECCDSGTENPDVDLSV